MQKSIIVFLIGVIIVVLSNSVEGRPADNLIRYKRQSDQRIAELETLLALQKYRHHRLRPEHKGAQPGFGVIDFNTIGRKKKSTRFSPGEQRSKVEVTLNDKLRSLLSYPSLLIRRRGQENEENPEEVFTLEKK